MIIRKGASTAKCTQGLRHCIESGIRACFTAARTLHMTRRADKDRKHDSGVAKIIACLQTKHTDPYTTTTIAHFWEVKDDVETVLPRPRRGHYNGQARSQCLIIRVFWNTAKYRSWWWPTVDIYGHFDTYYPCHCHDCDKPIHFFCFFSCSSPSLPPPNKFIDKGYHRHHYNFVV